VGAPARLGSGDECGARPAVHALRRRGRGGPRKLDARLVGPLRGGSGEDDVLVDGAVDDEGGFGYTGRTSMTPRIQQGQIDRDFTAKSMADVFAATAATEPPPRPARWQRPSQSCAPLSSSTSRTSSRTTAAAGQGAALPRLLAL